MSAPVSAPLSAGVPPVNEALEPAWVRHGSATTKQAYQTALAFEEMLVQQLTSSLAADGAGAEGEGEGTEGSGPQLGGGMLSTMLPQALSEGIARGGGLGLAAQLTRQIEGAAGATSPAQSGPATAEATEQGGVAASAGPNRSAGSPA